MKWMCLVSVMAFGGVQAQNLLFLEDFNSGFPSGWEVYNEDGLTPESTVSYINDAWVIAEDSDSTGMMDSSAISTSFYDPIGQSDDWLVSPSISLGATGNVLFWDAKSEDPSFPDSYEILISTTGNTPNDFDTAFYAVNDESPYWQFHQINIDAYSGQTVNIAFRNVSDDQFILFLDNIGVNESDPLSNSDLERENIVFYPNPARSTLNIQGIEKAQSVVFFDQSGREVMRQDFQTSLPLDGLLKGSYWVRINLEDAAPVYRQLIKL